MFCKASPRGPLSSIIPSHECHGHPDQPLFYKYFPSSLVCSEMRFEKFYCFINILTTFADFQSVFPSTKIIN